MSVPDSSSGGSGTLPRGKPNETGIGSSVPLGAKPLIFRPSVAPTGGTTSLFRLCNRLKFPTNFFSVGHSSAAVGQFHPSFSFLHRRRRPPIPPRRLVQNRPWQWLAVRTSQRGIGDCCGCAET